MEKDNLNIADLFKEEFKRRLGNQEYEELPNRLEMKPLAIPNLHKWRRGK